MTLVFWYFVNLIFFQTYLFPSYPLKVFFLRFFGAKVSNSVVIKPNVNIKYPWRLSLGNHCWIGEGVWIDNLANVYIGNNVCISQGAILLTGNHDYTKTTFDFFCSDIVIEDGVWIAAKSIVCPGVRCETHSVLSVGSVATSNLSSFGIFQGNPASLRRTRFVA